MEMSNIKLYPQEELYSICLQDEDDLLIFLGTKKDEVQNAYREKLREMKKLYESRQD